MFWRFGFHAVSAIDTLLDKEDVQLEAILDEDDLLQECKAQNTRLIDYFQRHDVLQRLFAYVTGQIEADGDRYLKYPHVATEVLCSEIWSIVETSIAQQHDLLLPFWESVLNKAPEETKAQQSTLAHFAKINSVFMSKKPAEMFIFIRSIPRVIDLLLAHIESPPFVDLLVRIVQLDEQPSGAGVLEWLSSENLIGKLLDLLSPGHTSDIHTVVCDLIKSIISMATPSPAAGLTDNLYTSSAPNCFARELARRKNVETLAGYILIDFSPPPPRDVTTPVEQTPTEQQKPPEQERMQEEEDEEFKPPPNLFTRTSSVVQSISLIIELIRKNNSDYFEPFLFHTLRNRLIHVQQLQQQLAAGEDAEREALERAMKEMVDKMGVVHLGSVLETLIPQLEVLQGFLRNPRSVNAPIETTLGPLMPLSFERYRITELFAELLHCSNMALLNRPPDRLYDSEGRLQGGLAALEELAQVISLKGLDEGEVREGDQDGEEGGGEEEEDSGTRRSLPVHGHGHVRHGDSEGSSFGAGIDSDEYMSDEDDEVMEEIAMEDEPPVSPVTLTLVLGGEESDEVRGTSSPAPLAVAGTPSPSSSAASALAAIGESPASLNSSSSLSVQSRRSSRWSQSGGQQDQIGGEQPVGERLKKKYIEIGIVVTLLDMFFEFPWNNFLHSAVYDFVHQILTGNVEGAAGSVNRELVIVLFRDARLMYKIVDGQKRSDAEASKPKGVRLGYMGHLTLISEDVITALERFPPELNLTLIEYAPVPGWDEYVTGRYDETRKKDTKVLGGGKPAISSASVVAGDGGGKMRWKIDEDDGDEDGGGGAGAVAVAVAVKGEFKRTVSMGRVPIRNTADFGPVDVKEEDEEHPAPQFMRHLAEEIHSSDNMGSSESDDDDDDDEGGWLSQSTFSLGPPPISSRHRSTNGQRRPLALDAHGFDDVFGSGSSSSRTQVSNNDPFNPNLDDGFGPFSEGTRSNDPDTFNFPSSFSDEMAEDSSFDSFGDFGDFQSAEDLTPTAGSWTFASGSSTDEAGSESGRSPETVSIDLDSSPREARRKL